MSTSTKQRVYKASDTSLHAGKFYYYAETRQKVPGQTIYDKVSKKQIPNPDFDINKFEVVDRPSGRRHNTERNNNQPTTEALIQHKFTVNQLNEALKEIPSIHVSTSARSYFRKTSSSILDVISKINKIKQDNPTVNFISYNPSKNQLLLSHNQ